MSSRECAEPSRRVFERRARCRMPTRCHWWRTWAAPWWLPRAAQEWGIAFLFDSPVIQDENPCLEASCRTADNTVGAACCRDLTLELEIPKRQKRVEALLRSRKSPFVCRIKREDEDTMECEVISAYGNSPRTTASAAPCTAVNGPMASRQSHRCVMTGRNSRRTRRGIPAAFSVSRDQAPPDEAVQPRGRGSRWGRAPCHWAVRGRAGYS